ncbi:fibronectin type III domain-containing protein [Nocardioides coralli]|uniref:fibronectin type III domain-containing protein n=1 Tax=Nocardioides coralli TaxID=2872154 RepID=UPI001CA3BB6A|nr:fibronectin type III domain-containing protein [Nocardioides coralli]QZY29715.1 fibronectin type III domain-containing protein [Nocardioides coralli]
MSRFPLLTGLGGLLAAGLVVLPATPSVADPADWCSAPGATAPCIVSVKRDGVGITPTDPVWQVDLSVFDAGHDVQWNLAQNGAYELTGAAAGRWEVVLDVGTMVPRVNFGAGRNGEVVRTDDGDGTWTVSMTAEPTLVAEGCAASPFPWPCPTNATDEDLRLASQLLDWHFWSDATQRRAFFGVDFWTNVEVTSFPPGVTYDDATGIATMRLDFGAPHFESDGTTVYRGHFEAVLPNDFLRENFFIPDPGTVTPASLVVAGAGPISSSSVVKSTPASPAEIEVTDMTFSVRRLKVRTGKVVPTRPTNLRASRTAARTGKVGYDKAKPRGAKVTGYKARCVSPRGAVETAKRKKNKAPVTVRGLSRGTRYTCRVRALSRVGPGPWSGKVNLARRP